MLCANVTDEYPTIAGYARVSTGDQSLDRQLTGIFEYGEREFGADRSDIDIYRDKSTGTVSNDLATKASSSTSTTVRSTCW